MVLFKKALITSKAVVICLKKEVKMIKRKALILVLLAGMLILAANAFALDPGTPFTFTDTVSPGATSTWTHNLSNTDFTPNLNGTEPYLIINSGNLNLNFTFTPVWYQINQQYGFALTVMTPSLDSYYIGDTYFYWSNSPITVTTTWSTSITESSALNAIADKSAAIKLTANVGTLNSVNSSTLSGSGVVAPEPVSMLLVGIGMAGMPFAGRFRRFLRRSD